MGTTSLFRKALVLVLGLFVLACADDTAKEALTVDEFISQIDELDGQTVSVTGFLGECGGNSCMIYRSDGESADVDRAMSKMRAALEAGATDVSGLPFPDHPAVSIGTGTEGSWFDVRAYFYQRSYVTIRGRASSRCRTGNVFCFDRAGEIEPSSIRSASAPS